MKPTYEEIIEKNNNITIKRTDIDGKVWWIPTDPTNSDYQAYLLWLENPDVIDEPVLPPAPPVEEPVAPEEPVDPTL